MFLLMIGQHDFKASDTIIAISSNAETLRGLPVRFIDPKDQGFTREEMIERYDYPEDDLLEVDLDWM